MAGDLEHEPTSFPSEQGRGSSGPSLMRQEEELGTTTRSVPDGIIRARKSVQMIRVDESVPRLIQYADASRIAPDVEDSGEIETLEDGSISIPILEEQILVTKRTVVRERIIIRKRVETEDVPVQATLRREHVDVESDEPLEIRDSDNAAARRAAPRTGGMKPLPGSPGSRKGRA